MPVKIRLARRGRKKRPYYHIVIADSRRPRDGKFIENIGFYNPMTVPATIELDRDKAFDWLEKGAQPTDTARAILKFKGVYYKKHLLRGVAKGALTEDAAMTMYQEWIDAKEAKITARREKEAEKQENFWKMVSGEIKAPKKVGDSSAAEAFREKSEDELAESDIEGQTSELAVSANNAAQEEVTEDKAATEKVAEEKAATEEVIEDTAAQEEVVEEKILQEDVAEGKSAPEEVAEESTSSEKASEAETKDGEDKAPDAVAENPENLENISDDSSEEKAIADLAKTEEE